MPAWAPFVGGWKVRRAVSSAPYNPVVVGARRNTHRAAGPVRPQPATATPAASSAATGGCETDPTGVATARLTREWVCFCGSLISLYQQLRRIATGPFRKERPGHTLQPTALVHEALTRSGGDD